MKKLHNQTVLMQQYMEKKEHVRQKVICKIKDLEGYLINYILAILSFTPYAKSISLSDRLLSPLHCANFTNEATPSHDIP